MKDLQPDPAIQGAKDTKDYAKDPKLLVHQLIELDNQLAQLLMNIKHLQLDLAMQEVENAENYANLSESLAHKLVELNDQLVNMGVDLQPGDQSIKRRPKL